MTTTAMALPRGHINNLPQELLDHVIGVNIDHFDSIRSSSLVCHTWRNASLRHLFGQAHFIKRADFERWIKIASAIPQVLPLVRKASYASWEAVNCTVDGVHTPHIYLPPDIALPTMPCVTTFEWRLLRDLIRPPENVVPEEMPCFNEATEQFFKVFPGVRELIIEDVMCEVDARKMLNHFRHLRSLIWTGCTKDTLPDAEHVAFTGDLSHLERLELSEAPRRLDWLVEDMISRGPPPLESVILNESRIPFSPSSFTTLLRNAADTLQELKFGPPNTEEGQEYLVAFRRDFGTFTLPALRSLAIFCIGADGSDDDKPHFSWTGSLMRDFPVSPSLKTILISLVSYDTQGPIRTFQNTYYDWAAFSKDVHQRLPSLETFSLKIMQEVFFSDEDQAETERLVRDGMPELSPILKFIWVDDYPHEADDGPEGPQV
ncbi:hypothetical protein CYLTODRAFT_411382 [Cylindrobasidium torrendii FP15055 ss-10]|uniref:F-box domain-containing protein n=1 Tax=Cylindrobasidium torrendii FP15055 ss-10 TaxID=1314674 RepID=A0A0D7BC47_9AGAR|nr:hypothetical protein CYLTODRAFT_411382 [Cylindrobasidium torrendii FP15055 ss-10]